MDMESIRSSSYPSWGGIRGDTRTVDSRGPADFDVIPAKNGQRNPEGCKYLDTARTPARCTK